MITANVQETMLQWNDAGAASWFDVAVAVGELGRSYCVGGHGERANKRMVEAICSALDALLSAGAPHIQLITPVTDRPGHVRRYAINPTRITTSLGWQPRHSFQEGLAVMVRWFLAHQAWLEALRSRSGDSGQRLGLNALTPDLVTANR